MRVNVSLVGFTGELRGFEHGLIEMAPVVVLGGTANEESGVHVARGLAWDLSRLQPAGVADDHYMHFLPEPRALEPGHTVWIAGPGYSKLLRLSQRLRSEERSLGAWETLGSGFRMSSGSRAEFRELVASIAAKSTLALHAALFDPLEKSHGDAEELFKLFDSTPSAPSLEQALTAGLYFHEMRDMSRYQWVREQAVTVDRVLESEAAFDKEVAAQREWLRDQRFGEERRTPFAAAWTRSSNSSDLANYLQLLQGANLFTRNQFDLA